MNRLLWGIVASLGAMLAGTLMSLFALQRLHQPRPLQPAPPAEALSQASVARVVRRAEPAVVQILVQSRPDPQAAPGSTWRVVGSGFVVDPHGEILTSAALVRGARRVEVRCRSLAAPLTADLVRLDPQRDVALLQVHPPRRMPALGLGPAAGPATGSYVVALGGGGVTLGVVSADVRHVALPGSTSRWLLQTDAPIPTGDLGGPLLDLSGRVAGMATYGVQVGRGIGFAVPAAELRPVFGRRGL